MTVSARVIWYSSVGRATTLEGEGMQLDEVGMALDRFFCSEDCENVFIVPWKHSTISKFISLEDSVVVVNVGREEGEVLGKFLRRTKAMWNEVPLKYNVQRRQWIVPSRSLSHRQSHSLCYL